MYLALLIKMKNKGKLGSVFVSFLVLSQSNVVDKKSIVLFVTIVAIM